MSASRQQVSKMGLPSINNAPISYSQRYDHMTKLTNYNDMNEAQIWKEYQKLRSCLKELNEEVLHHMEKRAYSNIGNKEKPKITPDTEGVLILLEDEQKTNELRTSNFQGQFTRLEDRIKYLASKNNLLDELTKEADGIRLKTKQIRKQNKDLKRNAQLQGRDLVNNVSMLDRLTMEQNRLGHATKVFKKHQQTMRILSDKNIRYKERISELQGALHMRVEQFSQQENHIVEEIHLENYQELQLKKEVVQKYEPIYKRNYLMKLKELESLVNSIGKHDKIINDTEVNIRTMRTEIDAISTIVGSRRKQSVSLYPVMPRKKSSGERERPSTILDIKITNDKNKPAEIRK